MLERRNGEQLGCYQSGAQGFEEEPVQGSGSRDGKKKTDSTFIQEKKCYLLGDGRAIRKMMCSKNNAQSSGFGDRLVTEIVIGSAGRNFMMAKVKLDLSF